MYYSVVEMSLGGSLDGVVLPAAPAAREILTKNDLRRLLELVGESLATFKPDLGLLDAWEETLSAFDAARAAATEALMAEPNLETAMVQRVNSCMTTVMTSLKAYQHSWHVMSAEGFALDMFGIEISKVGASSKRPNLGRGGGHGGNGGDRHGERHGENRCLFVR